MARWRLTATHYLMVPGTNWRYEETDRDTGERNEVTFPVGRHLNPENGRDCRSPEGCVVTHDAQPARGDWVFKGDPTPDMEPLDAEAQAITDRLRPKWEHPIESLPGTGSMSEGESRFMEMLMKAAGNANPPVPSIDPEAFAKLQAQVAALMEENASLKAGPKAEPARRRA